MERKPLCAKVARHVYEQRSKRGLGLLVYSGPFSWELSLLIHSGGSSPHDLNTFQQVLFFKVPGPITSILPYWVPSF